MNDKYLSVTTITRYLKHILDTDTNLQRVYIKGEINSPLSYSLINPVINLASCSENGRKDCALRSKCI